MILPTPFQSPGRYLKTMPARILMGIPAVVVLVLFARLNVKRHGKVVFTLPGISQPAAYAALIIPRLLLAPFYIVLGALFGELTLG